MTLVWFSAAIKGHNLSRLQESLVRSHSEKRISQKKKWEILNVEGSLKNTDLNPTL